MSELQGPKAWTYGEISYEGVARLQGLLPVHGSSGAFYDLGSGLGRMVLQVHLEWGMGKAVGVELSLERHTRAQAAAGRMAERLEEKGWAPEGTLELRNDNLLKTDLGRCS